MGTFKNRWLKLRRGKAYQQAFLASEVKQMIPYQIRALLKARAWTQAELADAAGLTQGAISRAANPTYGNLSINTCVKIAAGFGVAFVAKFVPYSELDRSLDNLRAESEVATFEEEDKYADALFAAYDSPDLPST